MLLVHCKAACRALPWAQCEQDPALHLQMCFLEEVLRAEHMGVCPHTLGVVDHIDVDSEVPAGMA
jgi:hypothetical protein